ncbi:hypothetical protein [Ramlibacter sp. PS4R-6]|uniref:hypothetical protein n=1 Tax=Ramlibacter sp. PS4R-6 TaxID=3133438 RepID=UPI0030A14E37
MSLFSWMFPAKKPAKPALPESSGLSRMEPTRPVRRGAREVINDNNAQPANRKHERMARRELLYAVVREAMVRAGVLSASYKFKVLSLDGRGRQFLVMIDLSRDCAVATPQLAEIEAMIAQGAKMRHDILVSAVYWRMSEHVAVGDPKQPAAAAAAQADSQPIPLDSEPAALEAKPVTRSRYEPIGQDEVAAFKQAMAAGVQNPAAAAAAATGVAHGASATSFDGNTVHGPQSYTLLTGFEDTEVASDDVRTPVLSGTQYGELN